MVSENNPNCETAVTYGPHMGSSELRSPGDAKYINEIATVLRRNFINKYLNIFSELLSS